MIALPPKRRVAVLVVHGVGDQVPYESSRHVAHLLQAESRAYSTFHEADLNVPVAPVRVTQPSQLRTLPRLRGPIYELFKAKLFRGRFERECAEGVHATPPPGETGLHHVFMQTQLEEATAVHPAEMYETVRLEGCRTGPDGESRDVHIYELFWSDLSRLGSGSLRVLGELFQLLFHVSWLGAITASAAAIRNPHSRSWAWFAKWQNAASLFLSVPIPLLNLLLFVLASATAALSGIVQFRNRGQVVGCAFFTNYAVSQITWQINQAVVGGATLLLIAAGLGYWAKRKATPRRAVFAVIPISACAAFIALLFVTYRERHIFKGAIDWLLGVDVAGVLYLATVALVWKYDRRRPGALRWYVAISAPALSAYAVWLWRCAWRQAAGAYSLFIGSLKFLEFVFGCVVLVWVILGVLFFGSALLGCVAVWSTRGDPGERGRGARATYTARLTLALSTLLFSGTGITLWAAFTYAIQASICGDVRYIPPFLNNATTVSHTVELLFGIAGSRLVPCLSAVLVLALLPVAWALWPSVLEELNPSFRSSVAQSRFAGHWLTWGFRLMRLSGEIVYLGMLFFLLMQGYFLITGAGHVLAEFFPTLAQHLLWTKYLRDEIEPIAEFLLARHQIVNSLGALVVGAGTGIVVLGARLNRFSRGFRPVLRVMLDVDNWMREYPRDSNPTARICARYTSLLNYIFNWRSQDGAAASYDELVIVSHSQGTVITADLLRFLHVQGWKTPIRIRLFTMGSPLRQLYSLRFPHLYEWARCDPKGPRSLLPLPSKLGVTNWVNAYRSGDYVGRCLWNVEQADGVWDPAFAFNGPESDEFCVGAGAHMHYWDGTSEAVFRELDSLITKA